MLRTIAVALLVLGTAASARAQAPLDPVSAAELALARGDARTALELARGAHARDARTLATIGRAYAALGEWRTAVRFYRRALDAPRVRRATVLGLLRRARAQLAVVRVDLSPGRAELEVDGEAAEWERGQRFLLLAPGQHRLVARSPGSRSRFVERTFDRGTFTHVHLALGAGDERLEAERTPEPRQPPGRRWLARDLGTGAIGLAGAVAAGTWAIERDVAAGAACAAGRCEDAVGMRIEEDYAALHTGLGIGVLLGAQLDLMLGWAASERGVNETIWLRAAAIGASAIAIGVAVGVGAPCENAGSCAASGRNGLAVHAIGAGLGMIVTQVGAMLDDTIGPPVGAVASALALAWVELAIAFAHISGPEASETWRAYEADLPEGVDACASIRAGDTRDGRFASALGELRGVCSAASANQTIAVASSTAAAALAVVSMASLFTFLDPDRDDDIALAAGPGNVTVRGTF
jgi:hypothetical protein